MSHWQKGKLKLNCSITVLQKALIKIVKEWKDHIKISKEGSLTINTNNGIESGYNIVIPQGTPYSFNVEGRKIEGKIRSDIGFKHLDDNSWETIFYWGTLPFKEGKIAQTVARMRLEAIARHRADVSMETNEDFGGKRRIILRAPVTEAHKIRA